MRTGNKVEEKHKHYFILQIKKIKQNLAVSLQLWFVVNVHSDTWRNAEDILRDYLYVCTYMYICIYIYKIC